MDTVDEAIKLRSAVADHGPLRSQNMPISIEGSVANCHDDFEIPRGRLWKHVRTRDASMADLKGTLCYSMAAFLGIVKEV